MIGFDAIIIGTGQAGPALAHRLAGADMTVAIVERGRFGGTCVNTGCMPTKTLVASARAAHVARRAADFGVVLAGEVRIDMARVCERAKTVAHDASSGVERGLREASGCTVFEGHARFESAQVVRVGDDRLSAPRIFINVGARARIPDIPGVDDVPFLTNSSILELDRVPRHLVVVGGSYVGLEFAQMHRRFGAKVTVVEKGPRLVGREDPDVSEALEEILTGEGIEVRTNADCIRLAPHAEGVEVGIDCDQGVPSVVGSHVLLAVGRRPNTDDLGLESAGITPDERGIIPVDDGLSTSVPGVWALGECNGRGAFTHTAYNDYEIVAANLLDGASRSVSDRILGYALYTDPPLGRVGMTETEARKTGRPLLIATRPMSKVGRAVERDETRGFMKVIADAETKRILGASILGINGDEAIHGILDAMNADVPYPVLERAVPIHPTVSELIPSLLGSMSPVKSR
jgi:pyruvate/2-oxoglutarate dehydrogenase complex dihydrolipoamide dehydrogenase (E3) component